MSIKLETANDIKLEHLIHSVPCLINYNGIAEVTTFFMASQENEIGCGLLNYLI